MNIRALFFLSIVVLISGCESVVKEIIPTYNYEEDKKETFSYYLDSNGDKVKHGLYSLYNGKNGDESHGYYVNGKKEGLFIYKWKYYTSVGFFSQDALTQLSFFNLTGEKVASCTIKNDQPYNGEIWDLVFGLKGIKWNKIASYKEGKLIKEEDCDLSGHPVGRRTMQK